MITYLSPGLRFFHQGQFEGRKKRISPHLVRAPLEPLDADLSTFYAKLLEILKNPLFHDGQWKLVECVPAWNGNESWDSFLVFAWETTVGARGVVVVNFAPHASQCYARLPFVNLPGRMLRFSDRTGDAVYDRDGNDLSANGFFLDIPEWGYHIFEITEWPK